MSKTLTEDEIMERLYDEAYEELQPRYDNEYVLHYMALELAQKRLEN